MDSEGIGKELGKALSELDFFTKIQEGLGKAHLPWFLIDSGGIGRTLGKAPNKLDFF